MIIKANLSVCYWQHVFQDYRIKMCANDYSFEEWNTIHHEMGHIQYFMQYEHLPIGFRDA